MARINPFINPRTKLTEIIEEERTYVEARVQVYEDFFARCGSPVEQQFLVAWIRLFGSLDDYCDGEVSLSNEWPLTGHLHLVAQKHIANYRVDFVVYALWRTQIAGKIVIEIDGHDFHERTKEQASRDKSRDRELVKQGYLVLRFTGSEIYRDPIKAVIEVQSIAGEVLRSWRMKAQQQTSAGVSTDDNTADIFEGAA